MPFIPRVPRKPEDFFEVALDYQVARLKATLEGGDVLCLCTSPSLRQNWPLVYDPYVFPIDEVIEWANTARWVTDSERDEFRQLNLAEWGVEGIGRQITISDVEIGWAPTLIYIVKMDWGESDIVLRYTFSSPIVSFEPLD